MSDKKFPSPEEIQREFESFVKQRFGDTLQVFTNHINPRSRASGDESKTPPKNDGEFQFNLRPQDVKAHLDRFIIRQDEAKIALAIAVCDHFNHVQADLRGETEGLEYSKQNVLLLGPTGVGKTYMIRKIADLIGVPFVKADATRFSETGYVGANVDDLIRDLVAQASGDIEKAEHGIVYLDEADKLATAGNAMQGRDVNGRGVQFGLLRLMEDADVDLRSGNDIQSQMQALMDLTRNKSKAKHVVNTGKILFIVSGAFSGLEDIISKRLTKRAIGFDAAKDATSAHDPDIFAYASTQDFINYGFEPEFIGRLPVRVHCRPLSEDDLYDIMRQSQGSIIRQYVESFRHYGIDARFEDEALRAIAKAAHQERTGARALMTVCERTLRPFKFELPSTGLREFVITGELFRDPTRTLQELLARAEVEVDLAEIERFIDGFFANFQLRLRFTEGAMRAATTQAHARDLSIATFLASHLDSYEHGLKLIQQGTGESEFLVTEEAIQNPQGYLEALIRHSFRQQMPHPPLEGGRNSPEIFS